MPYSFIKKDKSRNPEIKKLFIYIHLQYIHTYISEIDCKCRQVKYAKAEPGLLLIRSLIQACTRHYKWSFSHIPQNLHTSHILEICNKNYVYTNTYRILFIFVRIRILKCENMRIHQILTLRLLVNLIRIL